MHTLKCNIRYYFAISLQKSILGKEGISFSGRIDCPASHVPDVSDSERRDMIAHCFQMPLLLCVEKLNNTPVQLKLIRLHF
jgi:hypothetical protein